MNTSPIDQATSVLINFMSEMHAWEVKFHELYKRENGGPEAHGMAAKDELLSIYKKYVTEKERKTGRLAGPSIGYPPEFDIKAEIVKTSEKISTKKIVIETLWTHPAVPSMTEQRRYTMVEKNDEWRLDKKEAFRKTKDKWENRVL